MLPTQLSLRQVQQRWLVYLSSLGSEVNIPDLFISVWGSLGISCQPKSSLLLTLKSGFTPAPKLLSHPPSVSIALSGSPSHPTT